MTDAMLDPRITAWLDDGPSRAPDDAFDIDLLRRPS